VTNDDRERIYEAMFDSPALPETRPASPSIPGPPGRDGAADAGGVGRSVSAWYAAHGEEIYRYLRFQCDSADLAEDLVAETFLRAVRAEERFDPARASARTWLYRIARNVLRDHQRAERVRRHVPVEALRDVAIDAPSAEERLLRQERVMRLLDGVASLPETDRELLGLHYGGGLGLHEIAALQGLRPGAVRSRLWRALGRLREALEE
jgi:RNA polymerase sigma-70 factor (ECF subfamily)